MAKYQKKYTQEFKQQHIIRLFVPLLINNTIIKPIKEKFLITKKMF